MFFSAFYNNDNVYESGYIELPESYPNGNSITLRYELFNKLDEEFIIVFDQSDAELFVAKKCEHVDFKNHSNIHRFILNTFGEILEVFNVPRLTNIFRIFAFNPSCENKIKDIQYDYSEKTLTSSNEFDIIDFDNLTYLGEEMDGLVYFYDMRGNILIYADDDLMGHPGLELFGKQPADTFYTDKSISTLDKLYNLIFIGE